MVSPKNNNIPRQHPPETTLIVGLGNPILGDDDVGWWVAEEVSKQSNCSVHEN
ncbi:MAG: hypothetical protein Q3M30_16160 [Candidatus Electrothrix sp. Rat3]|nr:hypothetical protein [Candidatus Electrothrix rattekaaiensis]